MRYFFEITYNGSGYAGWQSQANATGVQTVVEDALSKLFRTAVKIVGSGRTDTGVHCAQQFFHTDIERPFQPDDLIHRLNSFLPRDIAIRSIQKVKPKASARYDAIARSYEYHITTIKDPLLIGLALHYFKPVNIQTMNRAAALLRGEHDFECFSKVKTDVNHFLCNIKKATWKKEGSRLVFTITANRFLRGMVRAIVGTLLDVGTGKISVQDFQQIISSKDRKKAGANVDPHGLYLVQVKYPKSVFID
ncbi:MAG: tRNA pseudouridine(38-40) synthase TruA [Cyclobacteriaceae bacterium]|nr:tRNA pseudouridine(38-40) synthase TruA [Cyclobacteriaceae bacterium]